MVTQAHGSPQEKRFTFKESKKIRHKDGGLMNADEIWSCMSLTFSSILAVCILEGSYGGWVGVVYVCKRGELCFFGIGS